MNSNEKRAMYMRAIESIFINNIDAVSSNSSAYNLLISIESRKI